MNVDVKRGLVITLNEDEINKLNKGNTISPSRYHDLENLQLTKGDFDMIVTMSGSIINLLITTKEIPNTIINDNYVVVIRKV